MVIFSIILGPGLNGIRDEEKQTESTGRPSEFFLAVTMSFIAQYSIASFDIVARPDVRKCIFNRFSHKSPVSKFRPLVLAFAVQQIGRRAWFQHGQPRSNSRLETFNQPAGSTTTKSAACRPGKVD
jgi:hypothetical protein